MVRNTKIKIYLIVTFVVILTLLSVLGGMSFYFTRTLADQTVEFYEKSHTIQLEVAEIQTIMSNIGSQIKEAMISEDEAKTQQTSEYIAQNLQAMNEKITIVKDRFEGDQSLLVSADGTVSEWLAAIDGLKGLMEKEQYTQAVESYKSTYLTAEDKMNAAVLKITERAEKDTLEVYNAALRSRQISPVVILGIVIFTILLAIFICNSVIKSITVPLKIIKDISEGMAQGKLHQEIPYSGKNEFGDLADSMSKTSQTLSSYVDNIAFILEQLSNKNMTVTADLQYVGDFAPIQASLIKITASLNQTMLLIGESSEQVASSAAMVSQGAQLLSQGTAEQASSVEELSASIHEISFQVEQNAGHTEQAKTLVDAVGNELESGNRKMGQMLTAISEINTSSKEIAKIIKTIEDIAFQTNILALNAAVEAARAGASGKGFAVVADEVRNLASKSSDAAKSTTALIQNSVRAVDNGTQIADDTASSIKKVVEGASKITDMISQIAASSDEQALALGQINTSVNLISQVIQNNSATSEESAAVSEQMSGQAKVLETLVKQFRLRRKN